MSNSFALEVNSTETFPKRPQLTPKNVGKHSLLTHIHMHHTRMHAISYSALFRTPACAFCVPREFSNEPSLRNTSHCKFLFSHVPFFSRGFVLTHPLIGFYDTGLTKRGRYFYGKGITCRLIFHPCSWPCRRGWQSNKSFVSFPYTRSGNRNAV